MEIVRSSDMGFCFGVRRAVEMMEREAEGGRSIASLGSVVHNPQVVGRLREQGVDVVTALDEIGDRRVAITAHGVAPAVLEDAQARGLEVVDTTCPIVTRAQQWAKRLLEDGFAVIVFGDPEHKEVRGILGWARGKAITLRDESEIDSLPDDLPSKIGVLVQTTHTEARFASFVHRLLERRLHRISELRVINTLCNATTGQQAAALHLAQEVDVMVVVGGRESANTRHLAEICSESGVPTHHVERPDELEPAWFSNAARVGVTAGASTPDFVIDAVVARLEVIGPNPPTPLSGGVPSEVCGDPFVPAEGDSPPRGPQGKGEDGSVLDSGASSVPLSGLTAKADAKRSTDQPPLPFREGGRGVRS
jgi:(E)-4-hydroxy-3-methyl-but-2-enyl pyrophosphate reductase